MTTGRMSEADFQALKRDAEERREAGRIHNEEVRKSTPVVDLTLETLLGKLDWAKEYAEHFVQPYCDCGDGNDGWEYCAHARDLGLAP